jgi:hypothetical protein
VSGWPNGLCYYKDGKWTQVSMADGLASTYVTDVAIGPDNSVWVGTDKGVSRFFDSKWVTYLPGASINKVHILKDNTAVFASNGRGILFFDGVKTSSPNNYQVNLQYFTDISGSSLDDLVLASAGIYEHSSEDFYTWYKAYSGLDYAISGTIVKEILPFFTINTITIDRNGTWWCGGIEGGIFTLDKETPLAVRAQELPRDFSILGNYPNPFNPSTTIEYALPETGKASLVIYNISGQKVRELVSGILPAGKHSVAWDGRDQTGKAVSGGVYLARIQCGSQVKTGKMLLLK